MLNKNENQPSVAIIFSCITHETNPVAIGRLEIGHRQAAVIITPITAATAAAASMVVK